MGSDMLKDYFYNGVWLYGNGKRPEKGRNKSRYEVMWFWVSVGGFGNEKQTKVFKDFGNKNEQNCNELYREAEGRTERGFGA